MPGTRRHEASFKPSNSYNGRVIFYCLRLLVLDCMHLCHYCVFISIRMIFSTDVEASTMDSETSLDQDGPPFKKHKEDGQG